MSPPPCHGPLQHYRVFLNTCHLSLSLAPTCAQGDPLLCVHALQLVLQTNNVTCIKIEPSFLFMYTICVSLVTDIMEKSPHHDLGTVAGLLRLQRRLGSRGGIITRTPQYPGYSCL